MNPSRAFSTCRRMPGTEERTALREWITGRLGLSLEIVQRKPRGVLVPKDVESEPIPVSFEVIRRR